MRRQTEPIISKEMLREIKLRPVSIAHKPNPWNETSLNNDVVSPRSSLNKILLTNANVLRRVKRFKTQKVQNTTLFQESEENGHRTIVNSLKLIN